MARILIVLLTVLTGFGCATGGGVRPTYPAPDLVEITPASPNESITSAIVPALANRDLKAKSGAAWLLKEYPSTGASVNSLYPAIVFVDEIPLAVKERSAFPVRFQHKGQPWEGGTTVYAGIEYKNVFSLLQNPGKYTAGEWGTVAVSLASVYFGYQEYQGSKEKSDPRASGEITVGPDGITGKFDGVNGTVTATFTTKTEGEESSESTTSILVIEQRP